MALYFNDVKLDLTGSPDKGSEFEMFVKTKINEIRKEYSNRMPLVFTFSESTKFKKYVTADFNTTRTVDAYPPLRYIPLSLPILYNGTMINVRYAEYEEVVNDKLVYIPRKLSFNGRKKINETELDLAFFLLYCYNDVDNALSTHEIKKINPNTEGKCTITFVDDIKTNKIKFTYESKKASVVNNIMNIISNDNIKKIALIYKIANCEIKETQTLRADIIQKLEINAKMADPLVNVYAEFEAKFGDYFKEGGGVTLALDSQEEELALLKIVDSAIVNKTIIMSKQASGVDAWWYVRADGKRGKCITTVDVSEDANDALIKYLKADKHAYSDFKENHKDVMSVKKQ